MATISGRRARTLGAFTFALLLGSVTSVAHAAEFAIDQRCIDMKARAKISCTCALQNGGYITEQNGQTWWIGPPARMMDVMNNCIKDAKASRAH